MTVAPLLAQALPTTPSPARPAQGESPSDLAGLFALLLAGAPSVQPIVARGADPGAPAAPGLAPALAGDSRAAVQAASSAQQPTRGSGIILTADALPPLLPLPAPTAAPVPAAFTPASAQPQLAPASPDASLPGQVDAASADAARTAPQPILAEPGPVRTRTDGAAASPLTMAPAPLGTAQTESAPAPRPGITSIALTPDPAPPAARPGLLLQTDADPSAPSPAAARVRPPAAAGAGSVAAAAPEAHRPHVSVPGPNAGAAGDQPAARDQAWLEPGSEAAEGALTRADQTVAEVGRAPAPGRAVPPAPVLQIGLQIAKAVPGRIERLVVQLEPAALGRVEVRLKFQRNDQVSAVIAAERPDTLDALQRDARLLERSLHQAGLRLDGDGLTFSLKREQAHHQAREESSFTTSARERVDRSALPARDQPPPLHWFRGLRTLDIKV